MPEKRKKIQYIWFGPETTKLVLERLQGASAPCLRFNAPFTAQATIEVVDLNASPEAAKLQPLNEAHPCPPVCL